tara:strand:- start:399 stop:605 length:207 start_codon:yes stop_codon:yes gene_type:complete
MKFILIASVMNLQMTYASEDVCQKALNVVKEQDETAFCIPAGADEAAIMFERFLDVMKRIRQMETESK